MHYQRYVASVERRRTLLQQKLEQANDLRREAQLPLRNVDQTVAQSEPLLTKQEFDTKAQAKGRLQQVQEGTIGSGQPSTSRAIRLAAAKSSRVQTIVPRAPDHCGLARDRTVDGSLDRQ